MSSQPHSPDMTAIYTKAYGPPADVLHLTIVPTPTLSPDRILVRIIAASTHAGDWHLIRGTPYFIRLLFGGITKPKINIPGSDFAGVVEAVGSEVRRFKPGDAVFGDAFESGGGAFAQFVTVPESSITEIPPNVGFQQAACSVTSGISALQALRDYANLQNGEKVLVNGASGGVGSFAVQIAKTMGADVTAVCKGEKMEKVRSLGADRVVDYGMVDVTHEDMHYDVIIDAAVFRPPSEYLRILADTGRYIMVGGDDSRFLGMLAWGAWISATKKKKAKFLESKFKQADLETLRDMLKDGSVVPLIDKSFSLENTAAAIGYLEDRKVCGKVVIDVQEK